MVKKSDSSKDDFEPLFDYHRVQPVHVVCLDDDDDSDSPVTAPAKRRKNSITAIGKDDDDDFAITKVVKCIGKEADDDWLPPPPKILKGDLSKIGEDSTIKQLRLKKKELASSLAESADDVLQAVEDSVKRKMSKENSLQATLDKAPEKPSKPICERASLVICFQGKDGTKQYRFCMDEKFERIFKVYAEKVKLDPQSLMFCFDGEKISPTTTPDKLGMEDEDIIEVHVGGPCAMVSWLLDAFLEKGIFND
ncbi:hypothetical protein ACFE04_030028 [Oxalis oulophora]